MKKTLLVLFLAVSVSFLTFAREPVSTVSETWLRVGFEFGNFFDRYFYEGAVWREYTGSPGINFSGYTFFNNRNVGLFWSVFMGVPTINSYTNNFRDFDFRFQIGSIIGVGFRRELSERFTLHYGVGLNNMISVAGITEHIPGLGNVERDIGAWAFGIGSDVGFKLRLNNTVFLSFGSIFTYDFAHFWLIEERIGRMTITDSGWYELSRGISIRPYFTVGFNIRSETIRF